MATTDQLRKAERAASNPLPPVNSFRREGWIRVIRAMDETRFGEPRALITWKMTKADLFYLVARRMAEGEPFPPRSAWGQQ